MIDLRIVSIGTLGANGLWGEKEPARTGHATTTLLRGGGRTVLVDPGLPAEALAARLGERANLAPEDITHVFLTSFSTETFRGIEAFPDAVWWISLAEREGVGVPLALRLREGMGGTGMEQEFLERALAILHRCEAAPDTILSERGERVDLFPLHGVTPGLTGLIVAGPRHTTVICGDAIATAEHLAAGQVLPDAHDLDAARASFAEAVEIADLLVPGRDNVVINPTKRAF